MARPAGSVSEICPFGAMSSSRRGVTVWSISSQMRFVTPGQIRGLLRLRLASFLPVVPLSPVDIAPDLGLQMGQAGGDLGLGKVVVAIIDGL